MSIENKCHVIEYLILLKLMTKKYDFGHNFYKNWVTYLLPIVNKNSFMMTDNNCYSNIYTFRSLLQIYNISNINNLMLKYPKYTCVRVTHNKETVNDVAILKIRITMMVFPYIGLNEYYEYEIPISYLSLIENSMNDFYLYNNFKSLCVTIYNESNGFFMIDYVFSDQSKKRILFELFKKIILRLLKIKF
jgi:hypothetical protein